MRSVLLLLSLIACDPKPADAPPPGHIENSGELVFTVDGTPVGNDELKLVFRRMRVAPDKLDTYAATREGHHVSEEYAVATSLYEQALAAKLQDDPRIQLELAFAQRQVLGMAMRDKLASDAVTEEAVRAWYERYKSRFDKPQVRASHIQVGSDVLAKDLMERIQKGEDFATLARAHSSDFATNGQGGDVQWFQQHENVNFGEQAFAAEKGALIGPIQSRNGFHVVKIVDKREFTPLEEVRPEAESGIKHEMATKQMEDLRKSVQIVWAEKFATVVEATPNLPAGHPPATGGAPPLGAPPLGAPPQGAPPHAPPHGEPKNPEAPAKAKGAKEH